MNMTARDYTAGAEVEATGSRTGTGVEVANSHAGAEVDTVNSRADARTKASSHTTNAPTNTSNTCTFHVENLNLWYGSNHALHDICIDIPTHEVSALIGPSGCGKSTFLRTLNRMNDKVAGIKIEGLVEFAGADIYDKSCDVYDLRKRVGMVFQKANPFPMSIYDNVAYGPRVHGVKKRAALDEIVEESLRGAALFDEVKDRLKKSALGLSGGQQQRLCIARALAVKPEVLLLDESTSALDPISTGLIEDLVAQLKEKYTVVMVTHNMQQAQRVADKCAFFLMGDLIEFAPASVIFNNAACPQTRDYVQGNFG